MVKSRDSPHETTNNPVVDSSNVTSEVTLKSFIPLCIIVVIHSVVLFGMTPVTADLIVDYTCRDMDAPSCSHTSVISKATKFTAYMGFASTIPMFLASGTIGVLSDRIGRRCLLIFTSLAPLPGLLVWLLLSGKYLSVVSEHWKLLTCLGAFASAVLGSGFVTIMAIFAYVADRTAKKPELRGRMFVIIEALFSMCGIIGILYSGQMSNHLPWLVLSYIILLLVNFVLAVSLKESTPPDVLAKPVNWRQANSFAAMMLAVPVRSTQEALETDFERVLNELRRRRDICIAAGTLQVPDNYLVERSEEEFTQALSPQLLHAPSPDVGDQPLLLLQPDSSSPVSDQSKKTHGSRSLTRRHDRAHEELQGTVTDLPSLQPLGKPVVTQHVDPDGPMPAQLKRILDQEGTATYVSPYREIDSVPSNIRATKSADSGLLELLSLPPPRNTTFLSMAAILCTILVVVALRTISVMYYKHEFHLKGESLTYVLAAEKLARGIGPIFLVPFVIKPRVKTRLGELKVTQLILLINAALIVAFVAYRKLWFALTISCLNGLVFVIPMGLVRHILSSEVSAALQGRVLSTIAAVEALTAIFSSALFSFMYSATTDLPIISYGIMGLFYVFGAAILFFRHDDSRTFNLRGLINKKFPAELEAEKRIKEWSTREKQSNASGAALPPNSYPRVEGTYVTDGDEDANLVVDSTADVAGIQAMAYEAAVEPSFFPTENLAVQYETASDSDEDNDQQRAFFVPAGGINSEPLQTSLLPGTRHSDI